MPAEINVICGKQLSGDIVYPHSSGIASYGLERMVRSLKPILTEVLSDCTKKYAP